MKKVLVVDDQWEELLLAHRFERICEAVAWFFAADRSGMEAVLASEDVDVVLMDGYLGESSPYGEVLVRELRQSGFAGKIFSISSKGKYNSASIKAGANAAFPKWEIVADPTAFLEALGQ